MIQIDGCCANAMMRGLSSGVSKAWLKIKNPKAPAATRATDGMF
jgi:hypothetical protein